MRTTFNPIVFDYTKQPVRHNPRWRDDTKRVDRGGFRPGRPEPNLGAINPVCLSQPTSSKPLPVTPSMPDLLLELLSEEIPARMQGRAADDLRRLVTDALVAYDLLYEGAKAYVTPRRLTLHIVGLSPAGKDVREEKRGPRVGAPEAAIAGFLKSTGLESVGQLTVVPDAKKGDSYVAVIERAGRPTPQLLSELLPGILKTFPWPKSMRWGAASAEPGSLRWVRPLQSILCTFGPEGETPEIVPILVEGIVSGDVTRGHRFMAPTPIQARRFDDYAAALESAKVVLDAERRREIIRHDARDLAFARGLEVVEDEALLEEVAGLVEWPVVLMGSFDPRFLDIPPEVIRATIRANQKCFVLRSVDVSPQAGRGQLPGSVSAAGDGLPPAQPLSEPPPYPDDASRRSTSPRERGEEGRLAPNFILVSNIEARDGGAAIVAGNERVVAARLSDAKFFWETDRKAKLEDRLDKLTSIVFHEKLGTQAERVERIAALARELAPLVKADPDQAERAARLAKADLVTEMVGEFPELQGLMGRYYATAQGEPPSVAAAIEEHYRPLGPSDRVPTDPVSVAVALADKLDTLVGFWAIGETPTGSKDPYALRRAALGVIRLALENGLRLPIGAAIAGAVAAGFASAVSTDTGVFGAFARHRTREGYSPASRVEEGSVFANVVQGGLPAAWDRQWNDPDQEGAFFDGQRLMEVEGFLRPLTRDLVSFLHDRLKVYLRDRGARHDLIDAVLGAGVASPRSIAATAVTPGSPKVRERDPGAGERRAGSPSPPAASPPPAGDDKEGASFVTPGGPEGREGEPGAEIAPLPRVLPAPHAEVPGEAGPRSTQDGAAADPSRPVSPAPQDQDWGSRNDDLLMVVRRVEALSAFLATEDGKNLVAATKRAANILRIEEKKDGRSYDGVPHVIALVLPEERALALALAGAAHVARDALDREDFAGAMKALAELRPSVDAFFEKVTVNDPDPALRENRLKLLNTLRQATREVADFSKIEG